MKNQNGITLVALVITIIVLLILAGVAIAALSGDNSILTRASEAGANSNVANAKEVATVDAAELITEFYNAKYVEQNTTNTSSALVYMANNWTTSDENLYKVTPDTTAGSERVSLEIVPKTVDGKTVTGTVNASGKITWVEN